MDKETWEKMEDILTRFGDFIDGNVMYDVKDVLDINEALIEIGKALKELGYRKLPKDKPPLLDDLDVGEWHHEAIPEFRIVPANELSRETHRQAQREADIKWYEGNDVNR